MGYKKVSLGMFSGHKLYEILSSLGYDRRECQRLCDKGRMSDASGEILRKNDVVEGEIYFIDYECEPRGISPIYENENFAVYDKPSGVLSHPSGRNSPYNMYDEIWSRYGRDACVAHRLDLETSGVLVVAIRKSAARELKDSFENRAIMKRYVALVGGKFEPESGRYGEELGLAKFRRDEWLEFGSKMKFLYDFDGYVIDADMTPSDECADLKIRMKVAGGGKRAVTLVRVLGYDKRTDATLVECFPLTGRQHQIRVHLFHMKHKILGDPLYGLSCAQTEMILDKKLSVSERIALTGASRLCLHASEICFEFSGAEYHIKSQMDYSAKFLRALAK